LLFAQGFCKHPGKGILIAKRLQNEVVFKKGLAEMDGLSDAGIEKSELRMIELNSWIAASGTVDRYQKAENRARRATSS
jgi:hypothetical protein